MEKSLFTFAIVCIALVGVVAADDTASRFFEWPRDVRLQPLKNLDDDFPFAPPTSLDDWNARRENLRRQILVAGGLWPLPEKTDLKPVVHHAVERDDYTVYGVILEVLPNFFVTGNLYVPKNPPRGENGEPLKMPGVLSPHGHWANGRFYKCPDDAFEKEIASGAEKYDPCGRFPLQARCVTLARLGCVVFHYDMIGYADSVQMPHRAGFRDAMNTQENWGLFSPQAELRLQSTFGLQTLSSIRALDWFETLPEVDPKRIAITGASGGGTQSFILAAIDDRLCAAFPAVMVSTSMQGGCTCENANYLRVNTGNVEIAALFAPKPLGLTAANDWTREMEFSGYPALKKVYEEFYDAGDNVELHPHLEFGHNYNFVSRSAMYEFMIAHLGLTAPTLADGETIEREFEPLTTDEMSVWTDEHPKPSGDDVGEIFERRLVREMNAASQKQIDSLYPRDAASLKKFRSVVGGAFETMIGRTVPLAEDVLFLGGWPNRHPDSYVVDATFCDMKHGECVDAIVFLPRVKTTSGVTIVVTENGSKTDANPAMSHLERGDTVVVVRLLKQGDANAELIGYGDKKEAWQRYLGYTYGYNHPIFAKRVHDVLTVIATMKKNEEGCEITLIGVDGGAAYAAAARVVAGDAVNNLIVTPESFRFANIERLDDPFLWPGAVKYGDLPALLALSSPHPTTIILAEGEDASDYKIVTDAYDAAGAKDAIKFSEK
ncbi:MAG: alpha/beta hydrolase family protein [Thermoguttaceae bacterium]